MSVEPDGDTEGEAEFNERSCSKSRIRPSVRRQGGRNFSCNVDYREHYLLIANPMAYARVHVYVCVPSLRGSGAERHARANAIAR